MKNLINKILPWGAHFEHFALLPGNNYPDPYHQYDLIFAAGARRVIAPDSECFETLYEAWNQKKSWLFGYLAYDLKNEIENLDSKNFDVIKAPNLYFFEPEIIGFVRDGELHLETELPKAKIIQAILEAKPIQNSLTKLTFSARLTRESYLQKVRELQNHIQRGDIYEVNFCQEFYAESTKINPQAVFSALNRVAHPPFAAFLNLPELAVMSASPERYLQKKGNRLVSQPIKGTAKRSKDPSEDTDIKNQLANSEKERAENVMIVDLVRNDLSRVAAPNSVHVPELFGAHTFPTVHQLISTVEATLHPRNNWKDALKATFPMGSMTGAPKVRAMQLIEQTEVHKRGLYSGALGYISPEGDFDFNVLIRSLIYNKTNHYLSASVGGAITILADADAEYEECLLKAEALLSLFR